MYLSAHMRPRNGWMPAHARIFFKVRRDWWVLSHKASWIRPFRCQGAWEMLFHVTWMNVKMFVDYGGSHGPVGPFNSFAQMALRRIYRPRARRSSLRSFVSEVAGRSPRQSRKENRDLFRKICIFRSAREKWMKMSRERNSIFAWNIE